MRTGGKRDGEGTGGVREGAWELWGNKRRGGNWG